VLPTRAKFGVLEQTRGVHVCAKFRLDRFILSPSGSKKPQILPFFGLWHFVVCQLDNYKHLSIQRCQNRFCTLAPSWRNRTHRLSCSKTRQTDTDKKLNVFGRCSVGLNPSPTKLRMVIRGPRARSCTCQTFRGLMHSFTTRGPENLGKTRPR